MNIEQKRIVLKQRYPHWNIDRFTDRQIGAMYEKYCARRGQVPGVRSSGSTVSSIQVYEVNGRRVVRLPNGMEFWHD